MEGARSALVDAVAAFLIEQRQALRAGRASADAAAAAAHLGSTVAAGKGAVPSSLSALMSSSTTAGRVLLGSTRASRVHACCMHLCYRNSVVCPDLSSKPLLLVIVRAERLLLDAC